MNIKATKKRSKFTVPYQSLGLEGTRLPELIGIQLQIPFRTKESVHICIGFWVKFLGKYGIYELLACFLCKNDLFSFSIIYIWVAYMYECALVCTYTLVRVHEMERRDIASLKLKASVSYLMEVLGTELRFSTRTANGLMH